MKRLSALIAGAAMLALPIAAQAAPVTLNLWTIDHPGQYHYVLAKEFEKQNPDIKINVKTVDFSDMVNELARAMATGGGPDITYVDNPNVSLFASRNLLLDLSPYVKKSDVIHTDDIYPGPLKSVTWKGNIYGIPRGANTLALYYNADMFKAHGLDPNKPPKTWDEFYQDAKKLNDPKKNVYGLVFCAKANEEGTFQFLPWVQMTGGNWNDIDTPGAVRALDLWKKLVDEKIASPDTLIRSQWDGTATFDAGNAGMAISGPWELPRMQKDAHFDFRAAMLPIPADNGKRASALGEGDNVVLANSKHPKAAFKFLEFAYMQMPTVWNRFGYLPAAKVTVKDPKWPEIFKVFQESMKYARVRGPSPEWSKISKAIYTAIQQTLTHQEDAKTALASAQKTISGITGK